MVCRSAGGIAAGTHGLAQFMCSDVVRLEVDVVQAAKLMLERLRDKIDGVEGAEPTVSRLEWPENKK